MKGVSTPKSKTTSRSSSVSSTPSTKSSSHSTGGEKKAADLSQSEGSSTEGKTEVVRTLSGSKPTSGTPSGKLSAYAKTLCLEEQGQGDVKRNDGDEEDKEDLALAYVRHLSDMADLFRQVCPILFIRLGHDYNNIYYFQHPSVRTNPDVVLEVAETTKALAKHIVDSAGEALEYITEDAYEVLSQAPIHE